MSGDQAAEQPSRWSLLKRRWGRWRDRLRWVTVVAVVVAGVAIWVAYLSGESFLDSDRFRGLQGEAREKIEEHEEYAETLRLLATGFAVVTVVAAGWLHRRSGAVRYALSALVAVGAVLTLVWTVLTGDAGAQAVWGS